MALEDLAGVLGRIGNLALQAKIQQEQSLEKLAFMKRQENFEMAKALQDFQFRVELQQNQLKNQMQAADAQHERNKDLAQFKYEKDIELDAAKKEAEIKKLEKEIETMGKANEPLAKSIERGESPKKQAAAGLRAGQAPAGLGSLIERLKPEKPVIDPLSKIAAETRVREQTKDQIDAENSLKGVGNIVGDVQNTFSLFNQISDDNIGPVAGRTLGQLSKFFKTDKALVGYESFKEFITSNIARQLGGERGVLTDRDVKRVVDLMPSLSDTIETASEKMKNVWGFIDRRVREKQAIARVPETGLAAFGIGLPTKKIEYTQAEIDSVNNFLKENGMMGEDAR